MKIKKICATCGTQFPDNYSEELCAVCNEERQYVPATGQVWITHDQLLRTHATEIVKLNENPEKGTMLCGDTLYLLPSMKHFAIMYSYPNRIPLPVSEIRRIKKRLKELEFDAVYGFYSYQNLTKGVTQILDSSIERYW